MAQVAQDKSQVIAELPLACSDEKLATEFMERQRWGDTPACPRCGDTDVYQMRDAKSGERNKSYLWRCHGCKRQFTVRIGTVLEDSRIPLRHWCYAFWAMCSSKKGVSALQIKRTTGLSYKSALFLAHRVRYAMAPDAPRAPKLKGTVEVDETFVGGKPRKYTRYGLARAPMGTRAGHQHRGDRGPKPPVVALVERNGEVRARVVLRVTAKALKGAIRDFVAPSARIMTDDYVAYKGIGKEYAGGHHVVRHKIGEYARGEVSTNTVEGFFALLKRGLYGTFHSVSRRHLHRYVDEFAFRYNTRKLDDGARTVAAIHGAEGKRLVYRAPTGK